MCLTFFVAGDSSRSSKEGCGPTHAGTCIDVCKQCLDADSAAFALLLRNTSLTPFLVHELGVLVATCGIFLASRHSTCSVFLLRRYPNPLICYVIGRWLEHALRELSA